MTSPLRFDELILLYNRTESKRVTSHFVLEKLAKRYIKRAADLNKDKHFVKSVALFLHGSIADVISPIEVVS